MRTFSLIFVFLILTTKIFAENYKTLKETVKEVNERAYNIPHFVGDRSTIVHLFEWKWSDVAKECEEFLGPKGFGGVQISPVSENIIINYPNRPWWERYQPISYQMTTRSGNIRDLMDMVERCNKVDVRIYVDVVFNHMTGNNSETLGTAGSVADYENFDYPAVPYSKIDFNEPCTIVDFTDPIMMRNCQLYGLRDLNQKSEFVKQEIVFFLNRLISIGVAGFNIDSAMHMWPEDLRIIYESLNDLNINYGFPENSRPYIYQEVIDLGLDNINRDDYTPLGAVTEYMAGVILGSTFRGILRFEKLRFWGQYDGLTPSFNSLVFMENQDTQRGFGAGGDLVLTYRDSNTYKAALAFLLAHPYGTVRLMSSFDFTDPDTGPPTDSDGNILSPFDEFDENCRSEWICEHRWGPIYRMVYFRNYVSTTRYEYKTSGDGYYAFERTGKGIYAVNMNLGDFYLNFSTSLPSGTYCDIISGEKKINECTGKIAKVENGRAIISYSPGDTEYAVVIHTGIDSMLS